MGFLDFIFRKSHKDALHTNIGPSDDTMGHSRVRRSVYAAFEERLAKGGVDTEMLAAAFLFWACRFCDPTRDRDHGTEQIGEIGRRYEGDSTILEWCCYLIFRFDLWHFQNKLTRERDVVMGLIEQRFLEHFAKAFGSDHVAAIYDNRMQFYARQARNGVSTEGLHRTLKQLIQCSSGGDGKPEVHDIEQLPVTIGDFLESSIFEARLIAEEIHMVPRLLKVFEQTYASINVESPPGA